MPGFAKHYWIELRIRRIFWRPARNRIDSAARWISKRKEEKPPRQPNSCGNDGPWKAWKAESRLSTLSTALGNHATAARFPHSHSYGDYLLYKSSEPKH